MEHNKTTVKKLKEEVKRFRDFVADINRESSKLVAGEDGSESISKVLEKEMETLKELVFKDELTQVLNRRGFYDRFDTLFKEALFLKSHPDSRRVFKVEDFSLIFVDADNFKQINDTYGHDEGDRVLIAVARTLKENIRDIDDVARLGGEEFVVGLVGANEQTSYDKAEELRKILSEQVVVERDTKRKITASFGIASLFASDADDLDELVGYADKAMYEAKTVRGKNSVVRYSELSKDAKKR